MPDRTQAMIGYNTLFQTGNDASPQTFTTLAEVTGITPPSIARDTVDATHMQSPDKWREFVMGLKDGGEVSVEMNYTKANMAAVMAEFDSDVIKDRRIVFPDGSVWDFAAGCTGFEPEAPVDDKIVASATFKVSGKPVFTAAA